MSDALIRIAGLRYYYNQGREDQILALDDINLTIEKGEFVAIIGHNGSGKSTLAKMINGLLIPSEGDVWVSSINTKDEEHIWTIRQKVGMVFQNPDNQIVAPTVEEDVAFGLENLGVPPDEMRQRVDVALRLVDMEDFRKTGPHLLSGGQKQRVAIAGILAMEPECIVLDEPTAMLDPVGRDMVLETVKELNRRGVTIIHVTHFMEEAIAAHRVVVLSQGRIAFSGSPREVFRAADTLRDLRLDVPDVVELTHKLRDSGLPLPEDILTVQELGQSLLPILRKGKQSMGSISYRVGEDEDSSGRSNSHI